MENATGSREARVWNVLCHASALLGFVLPAAGHVLGPLVIWLLKRGEYPEVDAHGKESLNFQLSLIIYAVVIFALCFLVIGFFLLPVLFVLHFLNVVLVIVASVQAADGRFYRYPFTMRLLK